jgi:hypothetical protein
MRGDGPPFIKIGRSIRYSESALLQWTKAHQRLSTSEQWSFDAGIGPRDRVPADMIVVRVMGPMKIAVVGAPTYFARRRPPRTPDDLARHSCVQYRVAADGAIFAWPFERNRQSRRTSVEGRVIVNEADLAVRAAVDGLGIAYTIESLAEPFLRSGQLVRVLEDWSPSFEGLYLYYPGHRQVPATLRAFIDMIRTARGSAPARRSLQNPFTKDRASWSFAKRSKWPTADLFQWEGGSPRTLVVECAGWFCTPQRTGRRSRLPT